MLYCAVTCYYCGYLLFAALAHDFSEIPNNTTTEEDGIVRFMCQIDSVPKAMISWERNGKPLPHNGRYGSVCMYVCVCVCVYIYIYHYVFNLDQIELYLLI
jgi:hypothetical protein